MASPAQLFMPAEHWRHQKTLAAWPDRSSLPKAQDLEGVEADVAAIANAIAEFEPVTLFARATNIPRARRLVSSEVDIRPLEVRELWLRDTGPVFVVDRQRGLRGLDLNFNCWGDKYGYPVDAKVAAAILDSENVERVQAPFTAEGGSIEVDGEGTLLITESAMVNDNRNPGMTKLDLEGHFHAVLGVDKVIWLRGVKARDITDAHVDALARFAAPGKVILDRPSSSMEQYLWDVYDEAKSVLTTATDARGRRLEVLEVEQADPRPFADVDDYELCLSYLNYLLVNDGVVIPAFGDAVADERALKQLQQAFPDRRVKQVRLRGLLSHGGGIHCSTQQVPLAHIRT